MATTSPDNIWTPDAGDDYALTVDLAATADTVQDALNGIHDVLDPLAEDTGWVSMSPASGFTAPTPIAVRRIGDQVFFKGDVTRTAGNLPTTSAGVTAFTLPGPQFRPVSYARVGAGAWGSTSANGSVLVFSTATNSVAAFGIGASFDQIYLAGISYLAE